MARPRFLTTLAIIAGLTSSSTLFAQSILYVADSAAGANNGSTWCDAYVYLQDALAASRTSGGPVTEIRVAQGTYKPDQGANQTPGERTASFQLINGVALRGGFAGRGEMDPDARNFSIYETVLSGDLAGDDGSGFTNYGENSLNVTTGMGTDHTAVLDGFTITAGGRFSVGSGLLNWPGSPAVSNCTFTLNASGAIANIGSNSESVTVTNSAFIGNRTNTIGAGIRHQADGSLVVLNSIFLRNTAESDGGGIAADGPLTVLNCTFVANSAGNQGGGGIAKAQGDIRIANCIFSGNTASVANGAGLRLVGNNSGDATITNCTFVGNRATLFGGGIWASDADLIATNSLFWNNRDVGGANTASQIFVDHGYALVSYNSIQEGWSGLGNIALEPFFRDADGEDDTAGNEDDDFRLRPGSPGIDSGANSFVLRDTQDMDADGDTDEALPLDLDGNPRFKDDPSTPDTGAGIPPIVDMGAYEYQGCLTSADCDDGVACTVDACDAVSDACSNIPSDALCDDGLFCNGVESCDPQGGCVAGTPPCDPANEHCDEATDECVPNPIPTVSEWGLVILTLLLLTSGKVAFGRKGADRALNNQM